MTSPAFVNKVDISADLGAIKTALQSLAPGIELEPLQASATTQQLVIAYNQGRTEADWINGWTADAAWPPDQR